MRTVQANLLHPFAFVRHAAGALRASGGSVILMASTGGLRGIVGQAAYSATKAGVINLTRVLAAELAPAVRVNCICPGWINTSFNDPIWELLGGRERESGTAWRGSRCAARASPTRSRGRRPSWPPTTPRT